MHGHITYTDNLKHNPIMRFINEQKPTYLDDRDKLAFIHLLLFANLGIDTLPLIGILDGFGTSL